MQTAENTGAGKDRDPALFRLIRVIVKQIFPKYELVGTENLPDEPCVIVGNHAQAYGVVGAELYPPRLHYIWCIGEVLNRKELPAYVMKDFWYMKPKAVRWLYRLFSHLIAGPLSYVLSHSHTIAVYHDARIVSTFRRSMELLKAGADIVIFPESREPYNGLVWKFHEHFPDLAKLYYRRTGTALCFVPMYTTPQLNRICFGEPVRYDPDAPDDEERTRICTAMMDGITDLAVALPPHAVIPYPNLPRDQYPMNTPRK